MTRIGGEMELDFSYWESEPLQMPLRLALPYRLYTDSARSACLIALEELKRNGCHTAWLPRYACDSVFQPFEQAGINIRLYSMSETLETAHFEYEPDSGDIVYYIHYFGKQQTAVEQLIERWRQTGKQLWVIEDAVQSLLGEHTGRLGNFTLYSLRKFLPVPDGGILASDMPIDYPLEAALVERATKRMAAKLLRSQNLAEEWQLQLVQETEEEWDGPIRPRRMSGITEELLARMDWKEIARARRDNWRELYLRLSGSAPVFDGQLALLYDAIAAEEVPLGFPLQVLNGQRDSLRAYLRDRQIYCAVHWPLSLLKNEKHIPQREARASAELLTLPIDQRYGADDMDRMAQAVQAFYKGIKG
ncbi:hypothetical protein [Cohnella hashimotonis]|uniref:DegT/DnrJ/EryC1/StrS aminotransferase family protein n=1 Tax=Cohnella hashimotonis TaxID=2826895 RepID=A0ABT6TX37_9BACL|nr:hypothetical protein [Cohnella hashimotonis]MDI4650367.1 hypothetical protein [Cohnella hashimotonis]